MGIAIFLTSLILILLYIFKPVTKLDEENFKNKNNWRGGF